MTDLKPCLSRERSRAAIFHKCNKKWIIPVSDRNREEGLANNLLSSKTKERSLQTKITVRLASYYRLGGVVLYMAIRKRIPLSQATNLKSRLWSGSLNGRINGPIPSQEIAACLPLSLLSHRAQPILDGENDSRLLLPPTTSTTAKPFDATPSCGFYDWRNCSVNTLWTFSLLTLVIRFKKVKQSSSC